MTRQIDAVFENGVLRPLEPLPLGERERVRLTVTTDVSDPLEEFIDREFLETRAIEVARLGPIPTLAEVQAMLSHDKSSWSDTIVAERRNR